MGKYMKKAKTTGEVAVMDLSLGVRTRARTLALKQQARLSAAAPAPAQPPATSGEYIQLRSRRLKKPPLVINDSKRPRPGQSRVAQNANHQSSKVGSRGRMGRLEAVSRGSAQKEEVNVEKKEQESPENNNDNINNDDSKDLGVEASFADNVLDIEGRERSTRESTPCSLIRDPESIRTPGSTTRPNSSTAETNTRIHNSSHRHIPTAQEMDQFFAGAEEEQHKQFIEKYNFDPVSDKPLPGRYEWEKLDP